MLKYRLIFGILFSAVLVGLLYADWALAKAGYTPNGAIVAFLVIAVIPFALLEMKKMLAKSGVQISIRIATVACLLCALWPWVEQVAEQLDPADRRIVTVDATNAASGPFMTDYNTENNSKVLQDNSPAYRPLEEKSLLFKIAAKIRTVKPHYLVPTVLAAAMLAALIFHSRQQQVHGAMSSAGGTLLAIVYLGVLPGFFLPIAMTHTAWMLLAILCIVKSADIGAYTVGRLIGKHKLIPWLSPGKTIEGFIGGLVFAGAVGAGVAANFEHFRWEQGLIAGIVLGAVGQIGDLLESLLKRDAGVKDSGVVPGFGGILDLLDSPLLAAPAAYWILKIVVK